MCLLFISCLQCPNMCHFSSIFSVWICVDPRKHLQFLPRLPAQHVARLDGTTSQRDLLLEAGEVSRHHQSFSYFLLVLNGVNMCHSIMIYLSIKYNLVYVSCFCMTLGNCMIYWVVRRVDMVDMADGELLCQGWSCLHSLCGQADQRAATWPSTVEATVWSYGFCSWDGLYWQLVAAAESVSEFLCGGAIRCNFSMGIILWHVVDWG